MSEKWTSMQNFIYQVNHAENVGQSDFLTSEPYCATQNQFTCEVSMLRYV